MCPPHCSTPSSRGYPSTRGQKPTRGEGFPSRATKHPPRHEPRHSQTTPGSRTVTCLSPSPAGPGASLGHSQLRPLWPRQHHSPPRARSSCPCRSCGFSGGPRPQGSPARAAARCPGGQTPSPAAPEAQDARRGLYWGFPICRKNMLHRESPFWPKRAKKKIKAPHAPSPTPHHPMAGSPPQ